MIREKDKGIIGAFMLYQDNEDLEELKARIIRKVIIPSQTR